MSVPIDKLLAALRTFPEGATTKELAERLGLKHHSLGSRLCKQVLYGTGAVMRDERRTVLPNGSGHNYFVWRAV